MNDTPLNTMLHELTSHLWDELLFYIPDNEILNGFLQEHKEIEFEKYLNKVMVMDYHKGPVLRTTDRTSGKTLFKRGVLKKDILRLLHRKADSDKDEFNFILELYYEQVECLHVLTKWLYGNIEGILPQDDVVKGLFRKQSDTFKAHFDTLIKQLYPDRNSIPKGHFNIGKSMELSTSDISKLYDFGQKRLSDLKRVRPQESSIAHPTSRIEKIRSGKTEKRPIISDLEAEMVLLKRIFNVDV